MTLTRQGSNLFFFEALYYSLLEIIALFVLLTRNYCLPALPAKEGGNKSSNFKEGGQI